MPRINKRLRTILLAFLALMVALSIVSAPVKPKQVGPLLPGAVVDPKVLSIFQRSCRDCHSGGTHYPWYSYVPPVSLLIQSDVQRGRKHLDLSRWNEYTVQQRERKLSEIANQVKDGDMPLIEYLWIHHDAKLSSADVDAIFQWTQTERSRLIAEEAGRNP